MSLFLFSVTVSINFSLIINTVAKLSQKMTLKGKKNYTGIIVIYDYKINVRN